MSPLEVRIEALRQAGRVWTHAVFTGMVEVAMDENPGFGLQLFRSWERLTFRVATHWLMNPSDGENVTLKQVVNCERKSI